MNPGAVLIAAGIVLIVTLLAIAYWFAGLIERAVTRFADEDDSVPARPAGRTGPADAAPSSASGPKVYLLHGRDND